MIRICMLVHQNYHFDGRVRRYAEALVEAGAQVDVLCVREPERQSLAQTAGVRVFRIPLRRGYRGRGSYLVEYGIALVLYTVWLLALHIKVGYQVIHVHNMPDFLIFAALIPRLTGAKLILDVHDPMPEFYMSKYRKSPTSLTVRLLRIQERLSAACAHVVITANNHFRSNLIARGIPEKSITVVRNLPDPKLFNRSRYERERLAKRAYFSLIYPGTIAPRYGLDIAIRALPALVERIPNLQLIIVGQQVGQATALATLADQLGVSSYVHFRPAISIDQVPMEVALADIGIYSALPDPHMDIAVPSKVLEFAMMGVPIIASRLKVLEELFSESAILFFEPGNVEQFARCVLELYHDPERREELVRHADKEFVNVHSWENEQNVYFDVLNHLLESRGAALATSQGKGEGS